jgi:mono/diheme cytochrome c family protein
MKKWTSPAVIVLLALLVPGLAFAQTPQRKAGTFAAVKQLLADRCSGCHDWASAPQGLADAGIIVPGDAGNSPLYQMVSTDAMPKAGPKLTAGQKEEIRARIAAGAPLADEAPSGTGQAEVQEPAPAAEPAVQPALPPRPVVYLPAHEISGFTASGLLLAAGVVGIVHLLSIMEEGHAWRDANWVEGVTPESARVQEARSAFFPATLSPRGPTISWWDSALPMRPSGSPFPR